jgi:hypothetical protein
MYEGEWVEGKRSGYGKEYVGDKLIYAGEWKNDLYDGCGKLYSAVNKIEYEGTWKEGKKNG